MRSNWLICFNIFNIRSDEESLCNLRKINHTAMETTCTTVTFQFNVSKQQKQLQSVIQIELD